MKAAAGHRDTLTAEQVEGLTEDFWYRWWARTEAMLRDRGGDWSDRALTGWTWLLGEFQSWRVEGDLAAMEEHWGREALSLMEARGLVRDPNDDAGWAALLYAMNDVALIKDSENVAQLKGNAVPAPPRPSVAQNATARSKNVSDLLTAYEAAKAPGWGVSSRTAVQPVFRVLRETIGDRNVSSIDRAAAREVFDTVKALPSGLGRRGELKGLTIAEAIAAADSANLPLLAPNTISRGYMIHASAVFNWAVKEEWAIRNPFVGLLQADPVDSRDKRDPFDRAQLARLFAAAPCDRPAPCGTDTPLTKPGRFWVPLVALWSGMRLGEITGIRIMDVEHLEGIPAFRVRPYDGRSLKNADSRRDIPIHPTLILLGFLAHV